MIEPNFDVTTTFLRWWNADGPWTLVSISTDRSAVHARTFDNHSVREMRAWLREHTASNNVYFNVNPTIRPDMTRKAGRSDIKELAWLHVDIDPRVGEELDAERERALRLLTTKLPPGVPPPSAIVFSGGGYQAFWRLDDPIAINGEEARYEDAKLYNITLEYAFGADNCHNVDRIMRLPGTINWPDERKKKKGRVPTLAEIVSLNDHRYPIAQFRKATPVNSADATRSPVAPLKDLGSVGLSERLIAIAQLGHHPDEPAKNSRSEWLFDFCCNALRIGVPEDVVLSIILTRELGISDSVLEHGRNAEKYARRQIQRARATLDHGALRLNKDDPLASARAFVARQRPTLCHYSEDWLTYDKGVYVQVDESTIASELYRFLGNAVTVTIKQNVQVEAPFNPTRHKVADILDAMRSETHVPREQCTPPCWLSGAGTSASELLAFPNGIVNLSTGTMIPPTERFFTRNALTFEYDFNAPLPARWLAFLSEVWPGSDAEIALLQEIFGYLLVPDTSQQKIFLLVGPKRSGKGTIGRVLRELVGSRNICGVSLDELSNGFGMQPLLDKQVVLSSDMRASTKADGAKLAENLLRISGEDEVTVARKYKGAWTGKLNVRFVIMTNEMPSIPDVSGALASRFVPLVMRESFYGREDPALTNALKAELAGILNWAIEGWRRLRQRGHFVIPEASRDAMMELENLGSPVKTFLRERCELSPLATVSKEDLFNAYKEWCEDNNIRPTGNAQFSAQLAAASDGRITKAKLTVAGNRVPYYVGVKQSHSVPF